MAFFPALRQLLNRLASKSRRGRRPETLKRPWCFPSMERLEDRTVLDVRRFINPAGGAWNQASNWAGSILPAPADDVVIDLPSVNAIVTHSTGSTAVRSLTSNGQLALSGGTLTVNGAAHVGNQLVLSGGILEGAVLSAGTRVRGTTGGGVLSRVSLAGVLDLTTASGAWAYIRNGFTLTGTATIGSSSTYAALRYDGVQTLGGTGTIVFDSGDSRNALAGTANGDVLTLGSTITVRGGHGVLGFSSTWSNSGASVGFVNQGTISADVTGRTIWLQGNGWSNTGTLRGLNGGTLNLGGTAWGNTGPVTVTTAGTLEVGGTWTNSGALSFTNATANFGGTGANSGALTATSSVVSINSGAVVTNSAALAATNSTVSVRGTLNNAAGTEALTGNGGAWRLHGGTIDKGVMTLTGGGRLVGTTDGGTLVRVTLNGDLDLSSATGALVSARNTLTVNGTVTIGSSSTWAALRFENGAHTLDGTGTVLLNGSDGRNALTLLNAGDHLNIGPNITIRGGHGTVGYSSQWSNSSGVTFTNRGTISADAAGRTLTVQAPNWSNAGTLRAVNAATLNLASGNWSNSGTLTSAGGTLDVSGTAANTTAITTTNAVVNVYGTINNTGEGAITATGGQWIVRGGTLDGGVLTFTGGARVTGTTSGGWLSRVTLNGPLDLAGGNDVHLRVRNGLTFNGTATVGSASSYAGLIFHGVQTLAGTGTVVLDGGGSSRNGLMPSDAGDILTLGAGITLRGGYGIIGPGYWSASGNATFINLGTIQADIAGRALWLRGEGWVNNGTLRAQSNGTLDLGGNNWRNTGTLTATGGNVEFYNTWTNTQPLAFTNSNVRLDGTGTNSGNVTTTGSTVNVHAVVNNAATVTVAASGGAWFLRGGTLDQGTLTFTASAKVVGTTSGGFLNRITLNGDIDLTQADNVHIQVRNGLTLNGTATIGGVGTYGGLLFHGVQTLGSTPTNTATVVMNNTSGNSRNALAVMNSGDVLTLGTDVVVRGGYGMIGHSSYWSGSSNVSFVNLGTLQADVAGRSLWLRGERWLNIGTLRAQDNGLLDLGGNNWTNNGSLTSTGGSVEFYNTWTNTRPLTFTTANVRFDGTGTNSGTFTTTGSTINVHGTLNNAAPVVVSSTGGTWTMRGGTIDQGRLTMIGGAKVIGTTNGGALSRVTLNGDIDLTTANEVYLQVRNGLTLNGIATIGGIGTYGGLLFSGVQTLSGTATVVLANTSGHSRNALSVQNTGDVLTLGLDVTVRGGYGTVGASSWGASNVSFVNQGTIQADLGGRYLWLRGERWVNNGTLRALGNGTLDLGGNNWTNNGTLTATGGGVEFYNAWTNTQPLTFTNAGVRFDGTGTNSGNLTFAASAINLHGTLNNAAAVVAAAAGGTWFMRGGTIDNGTVNLTGGAALMGTTAGGWLSRITLNGNIDLTTGNAVQMYVRNGLTLNGTATVGGSSTYGGFLFYGVQSLSGTAAVVFENTNGDGRNALSVQNSGDVLTLGAGVTVRGGFGTVGYSGNWSNSSNVTFINQGTIQADVVGRWIQLQGNDWISTGNLRSQNGANLILTGNNWSNRGPLSSTAGVLEVHGNGTNTAAVTTTNATVNHHGTMANTGAGAVTVDGGFWHMRGGTMEGGTVTTTGSGRVAATGSDGVLSRVTLVGTLDVSQGDDVRILVRNGLTLNGTATIGSGNTYGGLRFIGVQTLGGTGTVVLDSTNGRNGLNVLNTGDVLTIGPNITLRGGYGTIGYGYWSSSFNIGFINQGTIQADVAGRSLQLQGANWSSAGTLRSINGGTLGLYHTWTNTGSLSSTGATLEFYNGGTNSVAIPTINATVNVYGTVVNTGAGAVNASGGAWTMRGGTIDGGVLTMTGGAKVIGTDSGGALSRVTLHGDIDLTTGNGVYLRIRNGLTLNGTATIGSSNSYGGLRYEGVGTLAGTGTVVFQGTDSRNGLAGTSSGDSLTLGADITVRGGTGSVGHSGYWSGSPNVSFVNLGTIRAEAGGVISLGGNGWSNGVAAGLTGTITAMTNGTLNFNGTWTTHRAITVTGATVNFNSGTGTNTAPFTTNDTTVSVYGTVNNTGAGTLVGTGGVWVMRGGVLAGSTLTLSNGCKLVGTTSNGTLSRLTLAGEIDLTAADNVHITVREGLTLNGTALVGGSGTYGGLRFEGTQTLGGTATIVLGSTSNLRNGVQAINSGDILTLGPNVTIRGGHGTVGYGYWSNSTNVRIINQGIIQADMSGRSLVVNGFNWTNTGTLRAQTGATLTLQGDGWSNNGTLAATSATLDIEGNWTNNRAVNVLNATVNFRGTGTNTAAFAATNSTANVYPGTLTNTGAGALSGVLGTWVMRGGVLVGSTLTLTASARLVGTTAGGALSRLTVAGTIDLTGGNDSYITVRDGLTLNGTANLGGVNTYGGLRFEGSQTLGGNATVVFGSNSARNGLHVINSGDILTIAATVTIRGGYGTIGNGYWSVSPNVAVLNLGTIQADLAGRYIAINGTAWVNTGTLRAQTGGMLLLQGEGWSNDGTLTANGGTLDFQGFWMNNRPVSVTAGTVNFNGTGLNNAALTMVNTTAYVLGNSYLIHLEAGTASASGGAWRLQGGIIEAGTLTLTNGARLYGTPSGGSLSRVTLNGDIDLTGASGSNINVRNGLTLNGTAYVGRGSVWAGLLMHGLQTLGGTGTIVLDSTDGRNALAVVSNGDLLTIGPNITVRGGYGTIGYSGQWSGSSAATFINQGTIQADVLGQALVLQGASWSNVGTLRVLPGGTLTLNSPNWSNFGSLNATGGTVNFHDTGISLAGISTTDTTVNVHGHVTQMGDGAVSANGGTWILRGGSINNGAVTLAGTATLEGTTSGGTLSRVALFGNIDLSVASGVYITVRNGLTLNGTAILGGSGTHGSMRFEGVQTLDGTGFVYFNSPDSRNALAVMTAGDHLTLGPDMLVGGGSGTVGYSGQWSGSSSVGFTNRGTIFADTFGTTLTLDGRGWNNLGTIQASDGTLNLSGTDWTNNGTLASFGGTVNFSGTWTNLRPMVFTGSIVSFGGTGSNRAAITTTDTLVNISGTVINTSSAIALTANDGSWRMVNGTVVSGTLTLNGDVQLVAMSGGVLNNVTVNGTIDLTVASGVSLTVRNGLVLNGNAIVGTSSTFAALRFEGSQTLGGAATVILDGVDGRNALAVIGSGDNLSIAATVTIMGGNGTIGFSSQWGSAANVSFVNRGTISADSPGRALNLVGQDWSNLGTLQTLFDGTMNLSGTGWMNGGTLVVDGGTINFNGTWSNTRPMTFNYATVRFNGGSVGSNSGAITTTGSVVTLAGTLNNSLRSLVLRATESVWRLENNGTLNNVTLTMDEFSILIGTSTGGVLSRVTLNGNLDLTGPSTPYVTLRNGVILNGTGTLGNGPGFAALRAEGVQTLGGNATILFDSTDSRNAIAVINNSDRLTLGQNVTVRGRTGTIGHIAYWSASTNVAVSNRGRISADTPGQTIFVSGSNWTNLGTLEAVDGNLQASGTSTNFSGGTLTGGTWRAAGTGTLRLINSGIVTNAAAIVLEGSAARFYRDTATAQALAGLTSNAAAGRFTLVSRTFTTVGAFRNAGTVSIDLDSQLLVIGSYTQTAGTTTLAGGTLRATLSDFQAGTLNAAGMIDGHLRNAGTLNVAGTGAAGSLTVTGDFTQTVTGRLNVELGRLSDGEFDQIAIWGLARLDGVLNVSLLASFVVRENDVYQLLSFSSRVGDFASRNLPGLSGGMILSPGLDDLGFTLTVRRS